MEVYQEFDEAGPGHSGNFFGAGYMESMRKAAVSSGCVTEITHSTIFL